MDDGVVTSEAVAQARAAISDRGSFFVCHVIP